MKPSNLIVNLSVLFLVYFFAGCKQKPLHEKELNEYLTNEKYGLYKEALVKGTRCNICFRPADLLVAQDMARKDGRTKEKLKKNYEGSLYFILNVSRENAAIESYHSTTPDSKIAMQNLLFHLKNWLYLITNKEDTIYLSDYLMPRIYGGSDHSSFLLIFKSEKVMSSENFDMVIDHPLLTEEKIRFNFKTEDLKNIPELIF